MDNAYYIWSLLAGLVFQVCFYLFTKRHLDRIQVPYFARSDGERYQMWLIVFMIFVSVVLVVDPSFWYLAPVVALGVSYLIVLTRHREVERVVGTALNDKKQYDRLVAIEGVHWNETFVREVRDLSRGNFDRLTLLGLGLGGVLITPVVYTHLTLLFGQPDQGTYFRGFLIGINGSASVTFLLVYTATLMIRYLTLIKVAADRMDAMEARTPSV